MRYREAYFASKVATDAERHLTLEQLLHDTLDAAEIGLRAETKPDPGLDLACMDLRATVDLQGCASGASGRALGGRSGSFVVPGRCTVRL